MSIKLPNSACVIGASGKMGSGIAFLLLKYLNEKAVKEKVPASLILVDKDETLFPKTKEYLRTQIKKEAERQIVYLRNLYAEEEALISNEEIIRHHVQAALDRVRFALNYDEAKNVKLFFEAIFEDFELKCELFKQLNKIASKEALFFSNTSSIPISKLAKASGLEGRLAGFHFYNPPAIQKLAELILPDNSSPHLADVSLELAKALNKTVVYSKDNPGFIGNGHFIPEALLGLELANVEDHPEEMIYFLNEITEKSLIRPMGLFQLLDYVGLDVASLIIQVMNRFGESKKTFPKVLEDYLSHSIKGGQNPDGSQKDGIFKYEKSVPVKIYSFKAKGYLPIDEAFKQRVAALYGDLLKAPSWKELSQNKNKEALLSPYFEKLLEDERNSSLKAKSFLKHSYEVSEGLVKKGTALSLKDVSKVLQLGFYHLYGPDAPFFKALANLNNKEVIK